MVRNLLMLAFLQLKVSNIRTSSGKLRENGGPGGEIGDGIPETCRDEKCDTARVKTSKQMFLTLLN